MQLNWEESHFRTVSTSSIPRTNRKSRNLPSEKTASQINEEMYALLKKSRSDNLWRSPLLNPRRQSFRPASNSINLLNFQATPNPTSLLRKEHEFYKSQKRDYHNYLSGDQKFDRKFLLNTFFEIEANERNLVQSMKRSKQEVPEGSELDPMMAQLKAIKQKSLEEDLKALGQISDAAFFKFSEKLSLYNDYSTTFLIEPTDLTRSFLKLKRFRLVNWKKTIPMSAYVRRIKTLYNREEEGMMSPELKRQEREEREDKGERLRKNVIDAFNLPNKKKTDKEKEAFLKAKKELQEKDASMRRVIENLRRKRRLEPEIKGLFGLFRAKKHGEILAILNRDPNLINSQDEVPY